MYNEAIEILKKHVNNLKDEMKDTIKNGGDMPPSALSAVIFSYQNRINEVTDALLTLNSIEQGDDGEMGNAALDCASLTNKDYSVKPESGGLKMNAPR